MMLNCKVILLVKKKTNHRNNLLGRVRHYDNT